MSLKVSLLGVPNRSCPKMSRLLIFLIVIENKGNFETVMSSSNTKRFAFNTSQVQLCCHHQLEIFDLLLDHCSDKNVK